MVLAIGDYRAAIALAEEQHFGRAARRLGVTQPALTARLRRIEAVLGARLFERGRGGVSPTQAGIAFVEGASSTPQPKLLMRSVARPQVLVRQCGSA